MTDTTNSTTLWDLPAGSTATVQSYLDDMPAGYRQRLEELGFLPGGKVSCEMAPKLGAPRLYRVDNTIYSLDAAVARQLTVSL